ncbi:MAG: T9SS type A sorting domain-containing protein [Chlorobi bacterium]|nr:T9SS type A sorting domain-containing protein [Chlorobiota bacterium]
MKHLYNMDLMLKQAVDILNTPTNVDKSETEKNYGYKLMQNYPNPFGEAVPTGNPSTTIKYSILNVGTRYASSLRNVTLKVYDILGKGVATLVNEPQQAGNYTVQFDVSNSGQKIAPASGVYFYRLSTEAFSETKKMILLF